MILQADEKKVMTFGHLKFHPVYLTLGNLPLSVRMDSANWPVMAYLPVLRFHESVSSSERARDLRQEVYSKCFEIILKDFDEASVR